MKHIIVDLEMNPIKKGTEEKQICLCETIEIGAVMLDDNMKEISSFRTYVKPEYNDSIARKITKLTGITDEMVENAPVFKDAFRMFTSWCLGTGDEVTIYAWSDSDYSQISKEIILKEYEASEKESQLVHTPWTDFQHEFDKHLGFERQLSLKDALEMAGISFSGRAHTALDDARNTAELLQVFKDENLFEKTLRVIKDAMTATPLEVTLGSMIDLSGFVFA